MRAASGSTSVSGTPSKTATSPSPPSGSTSPIASRSAVSRGSSPSTSTCAAMNSRSVAIRWRTASQTAANRSSGSAARASAPPPTAGTWATLAPHSSLDAMIAWRIRASLEP